MEESTFTNLQASWCIKSDCFKFHILVQDRPLTRRGILSTVGSVYDPLGFLAPLLLVGKRLLQELCKGKVDWDDPIPENVRECWLRWREELHLLENLAVPRCFKPEDFGTVTSTQLHHFSDANTNGYGQCSYIRLENDKGKICCLLVLGKARVASLKMVTIPRLELTAAVVLVRVSEMLRQELQYEGVQEIFWTDSKVVLGYIKNDSKRFHVFVANRVQQIRDQTSPSQWRRCLAWYHCQRARRRFKVDLGAEIPLEARRSVATTTRRPRSLQPTGRRSGGEENDNACNTYARAMEPL